ncbi:Histone-lysine N-methyltransferase SET9 [Ceratocystis lukuohia]|uniref:Histone-lysine N-methyltransferase SET9 n=2 Tax=Ceratocystis TaxID=5157 RepID=A0A0F8B1X2_CERFI|nr:Histone-lysine N-methyltransferase SET9 [Ceratocystis platani]
MPRKPAAQSNNNNSKKPVLTLAQISAYDDILTDSLIDHAFYWTIVPKNRPSYHPSRGTREEEISSIITNEIIVKNDLDSAEQQLIETKGLSKFYTSLRTDAEKTNFRAHMRRYMNVYRVDCAWEVNSTNRYTIINHEASITARRFIRRNETIKYLAGIQVVMTPEEEREISVRKKDFSVVVSARSKCASLFMGPARFANHDCAANAKLMTTSQSGIEIVATRNIEVGEEITVTYSASYFGENNCDCLCKTCEENLRNGWAQPVEGAVAGVPSGVKPSIEGGELAAEGYSLRRRRRRCDDISASSASRSSSAALAVTEDIRPKVARGARHRAAANASPGIAASESPKALTDSTKPSPKRRLSQLETPPITPAKRAKSESDSESGSSGRGSGSRGATAVVVSFDKRGGRSKQQASNAPLVQPDARLLSPESMPESEASSTSALPAPKTAAKSKSAVRPTKRSPCRVPGDYTLTPLLLCEPEMAWIACTICSAVFVQHNAYYTKSACPRCERHSKLYGFVWPKTEPAGPRDREERVLDHRTVHRFLRAADELRARGRKVQPSRSRSCTTPGEGEEAGADTETGPRQRGR